MTRETLSVLDIGCPAGALRHTATEIRRSLETIKNPTVRHLGITAVEQLNTMSEDYELELSDHTEVQSELMRLYLRRIRNLEGTPVAQRIGEGILMIGLVADMRVDEMHGLWEEAKDATSMQRVSDERLWAGLPAYADAAELRLH